LDLDLRRRRDALPGAIRWQRPDTEPAGKSADKSTKITITGGAPLVIIRTERKAWGEANLGVDEVWWRQGSRNRGRFGRTFLLLRAQFRKSTVKRLPRKEFYAALGWSLEYQR
jgi:hypothetical protein